MNRIMLCRKNAKMKQFDFAKAAHVTKATVSRWERKDILPGNNSQKQLADISNNLELYNG